ncbi:MAG: PrsW family glutamic-type intramembrane protease [Acidobacteria bacterium]|jgi:RsiW-degrading membrane proteinase PrsW (M82 family)|nr:PrsW family glutamic-type intramembrane protease [Acidobacteriota bacterium]
MNIIFLLLLALVPGLVLLYIILYMDRHEKEPLGLVIKTMLLGALSVVPVAFLEHSVEGLTIYSSDKIVNAFIISFVQVAPLEELAKLIAVFLIAWKNKNFNEENDGIVYVGASALGFAMLENVFYVLNHGLTVGIMRAITAMPSHCFTGVLMGYYVGRAKFASTNFVRKKFIFKGFFLAYFLHGLYDTLLFTQTPAAFLILPMVVGVTIFGFKLMKKGRALSLARDISTGNTILTEAVAVPAEKNNIRQELLSHLEPKKQFWKIIVSRTLLVISGFFWILLLMSMTDSAEKNPSETLDIILGGILMSFIPIVIGLVLEISYYRKKKLFKKLSNSQTANLMFPNDEPVHFENVLPDKG